MSARAARRQALRSLLQGALAAEALPCVLTRADWLALQPALLVHGAASLAWRRIPPELARDSALEPLRDAARLHALRAQAYERVCVAAADSLDRAGIPFLLLKGWTLARLYPARGLRPYGDLDVLVAPEHARCAREALLRDDPSRAPLVDLHTALEELPGCPAEALIARGQPLGLAGRSVPTLAVADVGRYLCEHWLKHGGTRPTWLCDVALWLALPEAETAFLPLLEVQAPRRAWLLQVLACAGELLGAALPAALGPLAAEPWIVESLLDGWAGVDRRRRLGIAAEHVLDPRSWPELARTRWPSAIEAASRSGAPPHVRPLPAQLRQLAHGAGSLAQKLCARACARLQGDTQRSVRERVRHELREREAGREPW